MTEIYFADVTPLSGSDGARFEKIITKLSHERVYKALCCHLERDRNLSAGAGYLLSLALAKRGIDEKTLKYAINDCGKPCLADYKNITFSLSHSGYIVMCALTEGGMIGCDIESPEHHDTAAAKRFFCPDEYYHIIKSPDPLAEFRRLWTLKESYIKALGTGLKTPLSSFEVIPASPPYIKDDSRFVFAEFLPGSGYSAAVCSTDKNFLPPFFVNFNEI